MGSWDHAMEICLWFSRPMDILRLYCQFKRRSASYAEFMLYDYAIGFALPLFTANPSNPSIVYDLIILDFIQTRRSSLNIALTTDLAQLLLTPVL